MQYNKTYLIVQSLRAQNVKQKEISKLTGLSSSTVSKLLNNKQKSVIEKTEKKFLKTIKQKSYYNKKSKTHSNNYSDTVLLKTAGFISKFLANTNNSYNVMRRSKKLAKSEDVLEEIIQKYVKYKLEKEDEEINQFMTSDILKEGLIEIRG